MDIEQRLSRVSLRQWLYLHFPLVVAAGWVLIFFTTFRDLWGRWTLWDSEMAHGIPTMAVFFWLLWRSLPWAPPAIQSRTTYLFTLPLLAGLSVLWAIAYAVSIQIVEQLAMMVLLPVCLAAIYGWPLIFRHRLLFIFLLFAVPIWGSFNDILLDMASLVVGEMVRMIDIPAVIRGNSIHIPYGQILIADGCSGIRYFVIALTLAYLIGYLNNYREGRMALLLLIGAVLGLITNWIRIFILILIGYHTEMQSSLMQDHEMFGWILFAAICLPAVYFAPVVRSVRERRAEGDFNPVMTRKTALAAAAVLVGPLLALYMSASLAASVRGTDLEVASTVSAVSLPMPLRAPAGGNASLTREGVVYTRIDHYRRVSIDDKLVPYIPRLFDHQFWQRTETTTATHGKVHLRWSEFSAVAERRRVLQAQWFRLGDHTTPSVTRAKLLQVPAVFRGVNDFYIYTLQAECDRLGCERARAAIERRLEEGFSD